MYCAGVSITLERVLGATYVVGRGKRKHGGSCRGGVHADCVRNGWQRVLDVLVPVIQGGSKICLPSDCSVRASQTTSVIDAPA